jgi:hypothetical protein
MDVSEGNQKNDVAVLGLTELGDVVGQATETCSGDQDADITTTRGG